MKRMLFNATRSSSACVALKSMRFMCAPARIQAGGHGKSHGAGVRTRALCLGFAVVSAGSWCLWFNVANGVVDLS